MNAQSPSPYGKDCTEWLERFDSGRTVWTVEMGGLGPGYEQALQLTAVEQLRWFVENKPTVADMKDPEKWPKIRKQMDDAVSPKIRSLGLSGAQWGAAIGISTSLYMRGPDAALSDPAIKDRLIQIDNGYPTLTKA